MHVQQFFARNFITRRGAFSLILFGTADKMEDTFIIRIGDYHGKSQAEEEKPHHVPARNRRQRHDLLSVHKLHHNIRSVYAKPHKRAVRRDNRDRRRRANIRCAKRPDHGQHH